MTIKRDSTLDLMKGIAMLLVVVQHCNNQIVDSEWGE